MLKRVLLAVLLIIAATLSLASCGDDSNEVKVEVSDDGYVVVNGTKTEHKVHTKDEITVDDDGYLVVNGVKTEYAVDYCNHEYEIVTTPPTCTEGGYDTKTCKLCDKIVIANKQDAMGHDVPSYTIDGDYHYSECTRCDYATEKEMHVAGDDNLCVKCKTPVSATAGIVYDLSADGTYAIVIGYNGTDTALKIADTYKGVPVKDIYSEAFKETSITSVVISDSVTSIGSSAFYDCVRLTSVVIGDSVTSIGDCAFSGCGRLTSVVIGDSVTSIGNYAFYHCSGLTSVVIPDSVTSVGSYAFDGCGSLTSVVIPDSVTSIGDRAFCDCGSLTSVVIGDSVTSIGYYAFSSCNSALYTEYEYGKYIGDGENPYAVLIEVTNKNMSTYNIHSATRVIAYGVFGGCERLNNITIPDSVTSIGDYAFQYCDSLTRVVIGDSVTSIGSSAFRYCSSLTSVVIPDSVTSIGTDAFSGCNSALYTEYEYGRYVGDGENPYAVLIEVTNNMSTYTIHPDTEIIAARVFDGYGGLASIEIPDSVTSIGYEAFYYCSSLTSVVIPDSVTSIGSSAFAHCDSLTSVVIPDSVTSIGKEAFLLCDRLKNINYRGTEEQWNAITKGYSWDSMTGYYTITYNYTGE